MNPYVNKRRLLDIEQGGSGIAPKKRMELKWSSLRDDYTHVPP